MNTQGRKSPPVRRSGRSDAGKRRPGSGVGSRLLIMAAIVAAVIFGVAIFFKVNTVEVQGNPVFIYLDAFCRPEHLPSSGRSTRIWTRSRRTISAAVWAI